MPEHRKNVLADLGELGCLATPFDLRLVGFPNLRDRYARGGRGLTQDHVAGFALSVLLRVCLKAITSPGSVIVMPHDDESSLKAPDPIVPHS